MAFFECRFFSESLGTCVSVNVVLPQPTLNQIGLKGVGRSEDAPVMYLLHGLSDDETIWIRRTSVERYAAQYGLALIMPDAQRSYYTDMVHGQKFWTYVSEELPQAMQSFFRFSTRPEDTYVAGLSMGGYGAFKLAFNYPERFAAAASLSGAFSPEHLASSMPDRGEEFRNIFGELSGISGSINDLYAQSARCVKEKRPLPKLFQTCGTEDFLYPENLRFKAHLESLGVEFTYDEEPGMHEWSYWDRKIQQVIRWLPRKKPV
ncbi:MAG: Diacylglycerol acyltransferase/mycolyltransferase Ag85B precursor [Lentisphaerae bacterium ADurb.Bin242]|nr:MAG: Diacylglycerol acyltransferase/mycolyltransferase Ag85B precursor [Lentisphaerae bacterium ADurb.Bin242]